jgi:hypothetical protein
LAKIVSKKAKKCDGPMDRRTDRHILIDLILPQLTVIDLSRPELTVFDEVTDKKKPLIDRKVDKKASYRDRI